MELLPTAARELRLASRRSRTYWTRVGFNSLAILFVFGLLSPSFRGVRTPAETGQFLFVALSGMAFFLSLLSGAFMTSDAVSEEKREGTLGLLFLTDLRGHDVVLGKLVGKGLNPFYALISVLPLLALPMIIGGVTPGEFFRMSLVLLNTMFFSLTLAIAVSSVSVAGQRAWTLTLLILATVSGLPWALVNLMKSSPVSVALTQFSPVFGWLTSMDSEYGSKESMFWNSLGFIHFLAWISLLLACFAAPRFWQDFPPNPRQAEWQRRWRSWLLGSNEHQLAQRRRWLDVNPLLWLARRERHRRAVFWGFILLYFFGWLLCRFLMQDAWLGPEVTLITASVLHLVLKIWLAMEVSRRIAMDKQNGVLELLLVTPLEVADILNGFVAGFARQFLGPVLVILGADVLLLTFGMNLATGSQASLALTFLAGIGMFAADVYALTWVGLWQGLTAKNSGVAFLRTIFIVVVMPWLIFTGLGAILFVSGPGSAGPVIATWFAVGYLTDLMASLLATGWLADHFRTVAAEGAGSHLKLSQLLRRRTEVPDKDALAGNYSLFGDS